MGSSESSERNNGNNNTNTNTDQERKDEEMAKVVVAVAVAAGAVAGAAAVAFGICSILASINDNNMEEEDGTTMKAPGQNGVYIKRKDFEDDPAGYFRKNRDK